LKRQGKFQPAVSSGGSRLTAILLTKNSEQRNFALKQWNGMA